MDLYRRDDWRGRLADEMDRQRRNKFIWGHHDCAIGFAAGIIEAITGVDLAAEFRGSYETPREALRILDDKGVRTLGDFAALYLPEIHPVQANVGDLCVVKSDGPFGEGLGMVDASVLVVLTPEGHGHRPRSDMTRAFKVGLDGLQ